MILSIGTMGYPQSNFNFTPSSNDFPNSSIYELGTGAGYNVEALSLAMGELPESYTPDHAGINDTFPCKLYLMLSDTEEQGLAHMVSWQPHGRCFVVRNRKEFVKHIMPTYFRMTKFESFQRQLNLYGFNRITTGRDKGGYYHESFVRGRGDLCCEIQRHKVKGTRVRKPATLEKQPNFYMLPDDQQSAPRKAFPSSPSRAISSFAPHEPVRSSCVLSASNQLNHNQSSSSATSSHPGHSLVAMTKSASPEAFAKMLQSAAFMDRSATSFGGMSQPQQAQQQLLQSEQQQHQLQNQFYPLHEKMAKRLSLLWDSSVPTTMDGSVEQSEPMILRQMQQQQQQQQQQPYGDDLDRSFDALLSVLSRMDPTNPI